MSQEQQDAQKIMQQKIMQQKLQQQLGAQLMQILAQQTEIDRLWEELAKLQEPKAK